MHATYDNVDHGEIIEGAFGVTNDAYGKPDSRKRRLIMLEPAKSPK